MQLDPKKATASGPRQRVACLVQGPVVTLCLAEPRRALRRLRRCALICPQLAIVMVPQHRMPRDACSWTGQPSYSSLRPNSLRRATAR